MLSYEKRAALIGQRISAERLAHKMGKKEFLRNLFMSESSDKTLRAWESGERIPDLTSLARMAEIFQCDIGYLLCDYDERHRDTADIKKATGLSEFAIERLKSMWSRIQRDHKNGWIGTPEEGEIKAINTLLESGSNILYYINEYLFEQYDSFLLPSADDEEKLAEEILLCSKANPCMGVKVSADQMQAVFLLKIQKELIGLCDLFQGLPKNSNAKKTPKRRKVKGV